MQFPMSTNLTDVKKLNPVNNDGHGDTCAILCTICINTSVGIQEFFRFSYMPSGCAVRQTKRRGSPDDSKKLEHNWIGLGWGFNMTSFHGAWNTPADIHRWDWSLGGWSVKGGVKDLKGPTMIWLLQQPQDSNTQHSDHGHRSYTNLFCY